MVFLYFGMFPLPCIVNDYIPYLLFFFLLLISFFFWLYGLFRSYFKLMENFCKKIISLNPYLIHHVVKIFVESIVISIMSAGEIKLSHMYKTKANNRTIFTKPIICHFSNQLSFKESQKISKIKLTLTDLKY